MFTFLFEVAILGLERCEGKSFARLSECRLAMMLSPGVLALLIARLAQMLLCTSKDKLEDPLACHWYRVDWI